MEFTANKSANLDYEKQLVNACPVEDNSHLEKFAHSMFSELLNNFSNIDRLKVFNIFRELVKEKNQDEVRELHFQIEKQKNISEQLISFVF